MNERDLIIAILLIIMSLLYPVRGISASLFGPDAIKCPSDWNWLLVPVECRRPAVNCVPVCGKWPGDKPDIGAWEYVPGITDEVPWGIWDGVPFSYVPAEVGQVKNLRIK